MTSLPAAENEFSRLLSRDALGAKTERCEISASPSECEALARRFGLLAIECLSAQLTVRPRGALGLVEVTGRLRAKVSQACVVTLEPVADDIDAEISLTYTLREEDPEDIEVEFDPDAEDPPELIGPDGLDLGEAVVQQLAVLLDPYPRRKDAVLPSSAQAGVDDGGTKSPFAALKELKR